MSTKAAAVGLVMLAALGLSGCDEGGAGQDPEAAAVCVDKAGNRVDDSQCGSHDYDHNDGMSAFEWYFIMSTLNQPAVGSQVVHNTYYSSPSSNRYAGFKRPPAAPIANGVPKTGWKPSGDSKAFVPKSKTNLTAPKVIQQAPKPMYQQKPGAVNKPPAPRPPIKVGRR
jgi:hypothetical protein